MLLWSLLGLVALRVSWVLLPGSWLWAGAAEEGGLGEVRAVVGQQGAEGRG